MRKANEEFLAELKEKNPNVIPLSEYVTSKTKIGCRCKVCDHEWEAIPSSLLKGSGCLKCGWAKTTAARTKSHDTFVNELKDINPNIEIKEKYMTSKIKIKCRCRVCDYEWDVVPTSLLRGSGCPKCGRARTVAGRTKSHDTFVNELKKINPSVALLGEYKTSYEKVRCKCNICDYEWEAIPPSLLIGCGCPECGRARTTAAQTKTHETFISELKNINPDITPLGEYVTSKIKIRCKCEVCDHEWETVPSSLLLGYGCPKCGLSAISSKLTKTNETFLSEVQEKNPNIKVLDEYSGAFNKVRCVCKICTHEWSATPHSLLRGRGCPDCGWWVSSGERTVSKFLQVKKVKYKKYKTFDNLIGLGGKRLSFDFFIPEHKILIEVNGDQHYNPKNPFVESCFEKQLEHDRRKQEYAQQNDFVLVILTYPDLNNLPEILGKKLG